jgi:hypothetical protein
MTLVGMFAETSPRVSMMARGGSAAEVVGDAELLEQTRVEVEDVAG